MRECCECKRVMHVGEWVYDGCCLPCSKKFEECPKCGEYTSLYWGGQSCWPCLRNYMFNPSREVDIED